MSLKTRIEDLAVRIATEVKTIKTQYSGNNQGDLTTLATTDKTSLLAAVNELKALIDAINAAGYGIGDLVSTNNLSDVADATAALANLGGLTQAEVDVRIQLIVGSAPAALDTLAELAAALGDDANFATSVNNALTKRLRFDAAQTLTEGEKTQGQVNLDVYSRPEIGNPDSNFVTTFEAALV